MIPTTIKLKRHIPIRDTIFFKNGSRLLLRVEVVFWRSSLIDSWSLYPIDSWSLYPTIIVPCFPLLNTFRWILIWIDYWRADDSTLSNGDCIYAMCCSHWYWDLMMYHCQGRASWEIAALIDWFSKYQLWVLHQINKRLVIQSTFVAPCNIANITIFTDYFIFWQA